MRQEDNELFTRVGPGTPGGEMLRRYWWPVLFSAHVEKSPVPVRILGEDLILYRDGNGKTGLLEKHCAHRNASLEYGRVEQNGLRCCYHGWLYDAEGRCLDQPCEPANSPFKNSIRQKAYPTHEIGGFVFAYLGPQPVPSFPRYDVLFAENRRRVAYGREVRCNWLQRAENMVDPLHVMALHGSVYPELAMLRPDQLDYIEEWYGYRMDLAYPNGIKDRHHYLFPSGNRVQVCRVGQEPYQLLQFLVPVDDHNSNAFMIWAGEEVEGCPPVEQGLFQKSLEGAYRRVDDGWWNIIERDQDDAATESQGSITNRANENLGTSDRGIVLMRKMLKRSIEAVQNGNDPVGVIRPGNHDNDIVSFDTYKTELGDNIGKVRDPELGTKLKVLTPYA